jgi:hypothetical protein
MDLNGSIMNNEMDLNGSTTDRDFSHSMSQQFSGITIEKPWGDIATTL